MLIRTTSHLLFLWKEWSPLSGVSIQTHETSRGPRLTSLSRSLQLPIGNFFAFEFGQLRYTAQSPCKTFLLLEVRLHLNTFVEFFTHSHSVKCFATTPRPIIPYRAAVRGIYGIKWQDIWTSMIGILVVLHSMRAVMVWISDVVGE